MRCLDFFYSHNNYSDSALFCSTPKSTAQKAFCNSSKKTHRPCNIYRNAAFITIENYDKNSMKKTLNLLILLIAALLASSCSKDNETKDSVKELQMYVSPETGTTYDLSDTDRQHPIECMLVTSEDTPNGWEPLRFGAIEGFTYERGHTYELLVKRPNVQKLPADASARKYSLVKIINDRVVENDKADTNVKTEADIEYQDLCPYNKYKITDYFEIDGEGNIFRGNGTAMPAYDNAKIYYENIMDKSDDNWYKFQDIPYQAYRSYVISPLTEEIRLVYNENGGTIFKDAVPEKEFEYITKEMKPGEELHYYLIYANIYKKGLQKLGFTIKRR